ncbi:MAG: hypothetical protein ACI837_002352 [Crocinitomicaceae bacterium]|jgi:hypothetical protein
MKNLILGLMLIAAPAIFSQDSGKRHQDKFAPEMIQRMAPTSYLKKDVAPNAPQTRKIQYTGVVKMRNGVAIIIIDGLAANNKVHGVNLPKASHVDGRRIQFNMQPSRAPLPVGVKCDRVVILKDLSDLKAK